MALIRRFASGLAVAASLSVLVAMAATPATAAVPEFFKEFGKNCLVVAPPDCTAPGPGEALGSRAGETRIPRAIATDPMTGHVLVINQLNQRIDEFTPFGEFVKAFGWDVAPAGVSEEQEIRIRAAGGQFKLSFEADTTGDLPFNASAAEVQSALEGLASIPAGGVEVVGTIGTVNGITPFIYRVIFNGSSLKETNVAQLVATQGSIPLSGGVPASWNSLEARTLANGTAGGTGLEACTALSGCKAGIQGSEAGELNEDTAMAVDSEGNIYVADWENHRVQKFNSAGNFILMFGGKVNKTKEASLNEAERNLCTAASSDVCQIGTMGTGKGEFSSWSIANLVAIGAGDVVYVGDKERIQKFDSGGNYLGEISLPGKENVFALALAPSGNIFINFSTNGEIPHPNVLQLDPTGSTLLCEIKVGKVPSLASDSEGGIYLFADRVLPNEKTREIRKYDQDCESASEPFAKEEFDALPGIGVSTVGDVYAGNLTIGGKDSYIRAYGPPPVKFEAPSPIAPEISAEYAIAVKAEAATLGAEINPHFWPDTTYYLQYGTQECVDGGGWEAPCVKAQPPPPGAALTTKSIDQSVATEGVSLANLLPSTSYRYRFVAQSSGGGPTFGEEGSFFTYSGSQSLPDGRVYEKSSPSKKDGGEVGIPGPAGGGAEFSVQPQQAAASGGAVTYASATAFGENVESAPAASQYFSRSSGSPGLWSTENVDPRFEEGFLRDPFVGFSADLSHGAVIAIDPPLTSEAAAGFQNLYWRDSSTGVFATVTNKIHTPEVNSEIAKTRAYCVSYGGSSADSTEVFFSAKGALLPGDPVAKGFNLYEWSSAKPPSEALRLVSVLPNDAAAAPTNVMSFGSRGILIGECNPAQTLMRRAIADDGSKVFWTYDGGSFEGATAPLFARVDGTKTIQLDKPQGVAGAGGLGKYQDASVDGSKVFFTDGQKLTPNASTSGADLYLYDFDEADGEKLINVSAVAGEAANVQGVLGTSEDGSYAYFVAKGKLTGLEENDNEEKAITGAYNLYVWHRGDGVRFMAMLDLADSDVWAERPDLQTARVSSDGGSLTFLSTRSLTGFDNTVTGAAGCKIVESGLKGSPLCMEVFLYDYSSSSMSCPSCSPSKARPHGPALLPTWNTPFEQPRYLSSDGKRLFFETLDSLDPNDVNEKRDVYEFERPGIGSCSEQSATFVSETGGCLFLISNGKSDDESFFVDASTSGDDVFLSTRQQLVFTDEDERYDVYDARVGGSLPLAKEVPCEAEACRGPATVAPAPTPPGTPAFIGPSDPVPVHPCPKGSKRVKKQGKSRCVKSKKHKAKKQRHRAKQNERADG